MSLGIHLNARVQDFPVEYVTAVRSTLFTSINHGSNAVADQCGDFSGALASAVVRYQRYNQFKLYSYSSIPKVL